MKKLTLFYLGILMVFAMVEGANAQIARPESNSGKGFFVFDGKLYDASSMIDLEASPSIWVFPNPLTSRVLNIDFRSIERQKIRQIQLKNILGTTIKDFHVESALSGQLVLDGIAPGTYFLCFRNGQERFTSKLLITN